MNILGICGGVRLGNWDSAAALVVDGQLVAAVEEERLTRAKHAPGTLPTNAIKACLKAAKLDMRDIHHVVFPGRTYVNMKSRIESYLRFVFGVAPPVTLLDHHLCHAASAYRASGFSEALVVTFDFSGDSLATSIRLAKGRDMTVLAEVPAPNSLGVYYAMITQQLGFDYGEDEYKVMGWASYGTADQDMDWLLTGELGSYRLNPEMIRKAGDSREPPFSPQEALFTDAFVERVGWPRVRGGHSGDSRQANFAASAQKQLEQVILNMARHYQKATGVSRLCLAGGVALNCVVNQRLAAMAEFEEVFVPPVSGDAGLPLGAALELASMEGEPPQAPLLHAAWGPEYSEDDIRKACEEVGATVQRTDDPADTAAELLAGGRVIGWFQGRMEYGPRALGHRSILADPRQADMKDRVNAVVKFREGFRPFAPSVIEEHAHEYFEGAFYSPFMTFTFDVVPKLQPSIPAVTHVDGTARIQVVRADVDPLYHRLINRFNQKGGVPVLLNTSFNIKGQPIVESPNQALATYFGCGLDALIMGSHVLQKR